MLFNYKSLAEKSSTDCQSRLSEILISKYLTTHFQKISNLDEDLMRLPTENEFFFLQSDTAFNAFTFILLIAIRQPIKHLYVSTYSISTDVLKTLIELHDTGKIEEITILMFEDTINQNKLIEISKSRSNIKMQYRNVKAKVCLLQTHDNYFVIEGSGNWNDNTQIEQYVFAQSKDLFDFRLQLFTDYNHKKSNS